jgi:hypothetical protein
VQEIRVSRSFLASCGIPRTSTFFLACENHWFRAVVSHISRKTSEIWGTRDSLTVEKLKKETVLLPILNAQGISKSITRSMKFQCPNRQANVQATPAHLVDRRCEAHCISLFYAKTLSGQEVFASKMQYKAGNIQCCGHELATGKGPRRATLIRKLNSSSV